MGTIEVLPADSSQAVSKNGICTGQDGAGRDPCTNFQIEAK
jgi:hypothetical protein